MSGQDAIRVLRVNTIASKWFALGSNVAPRRSLTAALDATLSRRRHQALHTSRSQSNVCQGCGKTFSRLDALNVSVPFPPSSCARVTDARISVLTAASYVRTRILRAVISVLTHVRFFFVCYSAVRRGRRLPTGHRGREHRAEIESARGRMGEREQLNRALDRTRLAPDALSRNLIVGAAPPPPAFKACFLQFRSLASIRRRTMRRTRTHHPNICQAVS